MYDHHRRSIEVQTLVNDGWKYIRRLRDPPDLMLRILLAERAQQGRRTDNVTRCPKLDDQNTTLAGYAMRATCAVHAMLLVRLTRNVTTEMQTAVVKHHRTHQRRT